MASTIPMKIKTTSLLVLLLHRVFAHVQNLRFQVHVEQVLRRDQVPRCPGYFSVNYFLVASCSLNSSNSSLIFLYVFIKSFNSLSFLSNFSSKL